MDLPDVYIRGSNEISRNTATKRVKSKSWKRSLCAWTSVLLYGVFITLSAVYLSILPTSKDDPNAFWLVVPLGVGGGGYVLFLLLLLITDPGIVDPNDPILQDQCLQDKIDNMEIHSKKW